MAIRGLRYQELTMLRKFMIDPLETESTAADEDENAQADQNDGEQYMFPAFEDLGDGRTGGNEFRQQDLPPLPVDLRYTLMRQSNFEDSPVSISPNPEF